MVGYGVSWDGVPHSDIATIVFVGSCWIQQQHTIDVYLFSQFTPARILGLNQWIGGAWGLLSTGSPSDHCCP